MNSPNQPTPGVRIDTRRCIRCASCTTLVPDVLEFESEGIRVKRLPVTDTEWQSCAVAELNCPVGALQVVRP
jgi:ferredoxin